MEYKTINLTCVCMHIFNVNILCVSGRLSECFGEQVLEGAVVPCKMRFAPPSPGESWCMSEPTHLYCLTRLWSGARPWAQAPLCPKNTKRWHWGGSVRGTESFWRQILLYEPSHFITFSLRITPPNIWYLSVICCVPGKLLRRNGPLAWSSPSRKWFCWSRVLALWLCGCGHHRQYSYSCPLLFSVSDQKSDQS